MRPATRALDRARRDGAIGRVRPTRRGWALAGSVLVMAATAALFGLDELWCLAAAGAVLLAGATVWTAGRSWDVEVVRSVRPGRVAAGGEARVELTARNRSGRRSPPLDVRDPFDGGQRTARFAVASLPPGGTLTGSYQLPTRRRGVYRLGPMQVSAADAFGLVQRVRVLPEVATLIVHPRWAPLKIATLDGRRESPDGALRPAVAAAGEDFFTLREYVTGDDLRRVHWPSSARTGDLVVRQAEHHRRGRLEVLLDLRYAAHDGESPEALVSAASSLAVSALRAGMEARVRTTEGVDSGRVSGPGSAVGILDALASCSLHGEDAGTRLPADAGDAGATATVVLTTDRGEGLGDQSLAASGPAITVVVFETVRAAGDGTGTSPPQNLAARRAGPGRVTVRTGTRFADAWVAAEHARRWRR